MRGAGCRVGGAVARLWQGHGRPGRDRLSNQFLSPARGWNFLDRSKRAEGRWHIRNRLEQGLLAEVPLPVGVMEESPDCVRIEITRTDPRTQGQFVPG